MSDLKKMFFNKKSGQSWDVDNLSYLQTNTFGFGNVFIGLWFSYDGLSCFIGCSDNLIRKFTLSSPWDVSTMVFSQSMSASFNFTLWFKPDGLKIITTGGQFSSTWGFREHILSTPFDLSTLVSSNFYIHGFRAYGTWFSSDGLTFFRSNTTGASMQKCTLSTAWDTSSTITVVQDVDLGITGAGVRGIFLEDTGNYLIVSDSNNDSFWSYKMSTPFDLTTISLTGQYPYETQAMTGISAKQDGTKFIACGQGGSQIFEYDWS